MPSRFSHFWFALLHIAIFVSSHTYAKILHSVCACAVYLSIYTSFEHMYWLVCVCVRVEACYYTWGMGTLYVSVVSYVLHTYINCENFLIFDAYVFEYFVLLLFSFFLFVSFYVRSQQRHDKILLSLKCVAMPSFLRFSIFYIYFMNMNIE